LGESASQDSWNVSSAKLQVLDNLLISRASAKAREICGAAEDVVGDGCFYDSPLFICFQNS
jgi:hypothetical protein